MATKPSLRDALCAKTGWTKQQLSARAVRLRVTMPMELSTAHAVIAHQQNMKLDRYLTAAELTHVRHVLTQLQSSGTTTGPSKGSGGGARPRTPATTGVRRGPPAPTARGPRPLVFANMPILRDVLLSEVKLREAQEMAEIYPLLYVIENSMREVVRRVMAHQHGVNWWDTAMTKGKLNTVRTNADVRRSGEKVQRWHQRRGSDPLDYVDLSDLGAIILGKQALFFPDVLGTQREWFEQFMRELEPSRNVVCHMNPLTTLNVRDVRLRAEKWFAMLEQQQHKIPPSVTARPHAASA